MSLKTVTVFQIVLQSGRICVVNCFYLSPLDELTVLRDFQIAKATS